jgi:hypothetical protein
VSRSGSPSPVLPRGTLSNADAIITPNEANPRHGIGIIVERFFADGGANTVSIRSHDTFGGEQSFGAQRLLISHAGLARWQSFELLLRILNANTISRIVCIPFFPDDLVSAICLKELFTCPLCIYVMDGNNIGAHGIPDELFREALVKAELRLAISPEIRDAYEKKFGVPFFVLPPLVQREHILTEPVLPEAVFLERRAGALVGNVWSQKWLERLRATTRAAGVRLSWYGNTNANWLSYSQDELEADGITIEGFLPEEYLIEKLRWHPFAVIPSGSLDEQDDRPELARLSLPSRIPYLAAVANLPLLVLGHPETAAGHFVQRFGLGLVSPYHGRALHAAVEQLTTPEEQIRCRKHAAENACAFTMENPGKWLWKSLAKGGPIDDRFELLMPKA